MAIMSTGRSRLDLQQLRSKDYARRTAVSTPVNCCELCGRETNPSKSYWIRLSTSGEVVGRDEPLEESEDLGCWQVGESCLRRHPALMAWAWR